MNDAPVTYREAVALAIADEMEADQRVLCLGEDIGAAGGVFKTSVGLFGRFGPDRVRDTPISEQAIVGAALGAALTGLRPVAELMFADFAGVAFDQLANQLAKYRYMSGGQASVPVTVRMAGGAGLGFAAQHSQTAESWFLNVPGLIVCAPSTPADAYGLLRSAIRDENPVIVIEHKALYAEKGEIHRGETVPLRHARVVRPGAGVTVIASQQMLQRCLAVADVLADDGIDVEVIDPLTLSPFDMPTVLASVGKTGRLVCVQECPAAASWGATVVAHAAERAFDALDGPPLLIASDDTPVPYSGDLEDLWMPTKERIEDGIRRVASH